MGAIRKLDDTEAARARVEDPYPVYRRLRETSPVVRIEHGDEPEFVVTGYEEVRELLRDDRLSADRTRSPRLRRLLEAAPEALRPDTARRSMLARDDPAHARLRRLVNQTFTRRSVSLLEPRIRSIARILLTGASRGGHFDAVADFAEPLTTLVIAEILGVDARDHERFRHCTRRLLSALFEEDGPDDRVVRAQRLLDGLWLELIRVRREAPRDDLVSDLLEARDAQGEISDREMLAMLNLILVAGHETSANLLASILWTLLRDPDRRAEVHSWDDARWENVVEETLRWQSPIQSIARVVGAQLDVADASLPVGAALTLVLGAANRDPRVFDDPDHFDPDRENAKLHLAFGFGDHFCLGAALARSEVCIAAREAFEVLPDLRLEGNAAGRWRPNPFMRGLERLPVRARAMPRVE